MPTECELNVAEVTDRGEFQSTNERQIWDSDNAHKNEFTPNLDCKAVPFFSPNLSERRGCDWRGPGISRQSHPRRSLVGREKRDCFAVYTKSVRINLTYLLCNRNLSEAAVSLILLNLKPAALSQCIYTQLTRHFFFIPANEQLLSPTNEQRACRPNNRGFPLRHFFENDNIVSKG